jgi:hypothetical protein
MGRSRLDMYVNSVLYRLQADSLVLDMTSDEDGRCEHF